MSSCDNVLPFLSVAGRSPLSPQPQVNAGAVEGSSQTAQHPQVGPMHLCSTRQDPSLVTLPVEAVAQGDKVSGEFALVQVETMKVTGLQPMASLHDLPYFLFLFRFL